MAKDTTLIRQMCERSKHIRQLYEKYGEPFKANKNDIYCSDMQTDDKADSEHLWDLYEFLHQHPKGSYEIVCVKSLSRLLLTELADLEDPTGALDDLYFIQERHTKLLHDGGKEWLIRIKPRT